MFSAESLGTLLLSLATGFPDRPRTWCRPATSSPRTSADALATAGRQRGPRRPGTRPRRRHAPGRHQTTSSPTSATGQPSTSARESPPSARTSSSATSAPPRRTRAGQVGALLPDLLPPLRGLPRQADPDPRDRHLPGRAGHVAVVFGPQVALVGVDIDEGREGGIRSPARRRDRGPDRSGVPPPRGRAARALRHHHRRRRARDAAADRHRGDPVPVARRRRRLPRGGLPHVLLGLLPGRPQPQRHLHGVGEGPARRRQRLPPAR